MTTRSTALFLALSLTQSASPQAPPKLPLKDQNDSYAIYSAVLQTKAPNVKAWTIVQQTRDFKLCLNPAPGQEFIYRPLFDDYALKNKQAFVLERKFNLPGYTLVAPEEWTRKPPPRAFAVFSAVGFNSDHTRAAVCLWGRTSGTCNVLIKSTSVWLIDKAWRGDGCGWAA